MSSQAARNLPETPPTVAPSPPTPEHAESRHLRLVPGATKSSVASAGTLTTGIEDHPSNGRHRRPALAALPAPRTEPAVNPTLLLGLAILAVEVLDGVRNVSQLQGMVTDEVMSQFRERAALRADLRVMTRDQRRRVPQPVGLRSSRPAPGVVEAAVVLKNEARAFAVALRLDYSTRHGMWRASCLTVL